MHYKPGEWAVVLMVGYRFSSVPVQFLSVPVHFAGPSSYFRQYRLAKILAPSLFCNKANLQTNIKAGMMQTLAVAGTITCISITVYILYNLLCIYYIIQISRPRGRHSQITSLGTNTHDPHFVSLTSKVKVFPNTVVVIQ